MVGEFGQCASGGLITTISPPFAHVPRRMPQQSVSAARFLRSAFTTFGAFARLEDGIEGLIHISELSDDRINHPKDVVVEGDTIKARIIRIDPARKRIGLSLRNTSDELSDSPEDADPLAASDDEPDGDAESDAQA